MITVVDHVRPWLTPSSTLAAFPLMRVDHAGEALATIRASDGAVFWRDGFLLFATPDGERVERLLATPLPGYPYSTSLAGAVPGRIALNVATNHDAKGSLVFQYRLLIIDVTLT
jgi:hypothetical protein